MSTGVREPLDAAKIIDTALALIDTHGLDGFSTRKLAAEFAVTPMSLYHYFEGRDALLSAVVDHVLESVEIPKRGRGSWKSGVRRLLTSFRGQLLRHVEVLPLLASAKYWSPALLAVGNELFEILAESGCTHHAAVRAHRILMHHTFGNLLVQGSDPDPGAIKRARHMLESTELSPVARKRLQSTFELARAAAEDDEKDFTASLDCLIAGLDATVLRTRR
ncbi:MAG: TetR/AcrR family transcriptional regulator C-terminal domain-containing protein [Polyangiales bacterium]